MGIAGSECACTTDDVTMWKRRLRRCFGGSKYIFASFCSRSNTRLSFICYLASARDSLPAWRSYRNKITSTVMLCAPNNRRRPFSYHKKMADFEYSSCFVRLLVKKKVVFLKFVLRNSSAQHTEDTSVKRRYVFYFSDRFRLTTADFFRKLKINPSKAGLLKPRSINPHPQPTFYANQDLKAQL